jgi:serine/threonine protein kinase
LTDTDKNDDLWLIAVAADVCEGKPVDWQRVRRETGGNQETEAILRGLQRLAGVVDAHRSIIDQAPASAAPADHPKVWRHLVLLDVAGTGAFGTVYRAWDARLEREVALKLLTVQPSRSPLIEAHHLARIRHPNVVTVYGAEQLDQQVGIWMEFIEGETLASFVSRHGPMSPREVAGVGIDLCRALSALHSAGLLHRDVKAQNLMREVGGRIVLMDFSGTGAADPAARNELSGTPLYMAPEQLEGQPASAATDTYSAGVLLFYLFSGRLPVEGSTLSGVRRAHIEGRRVRLRDLRPELPDTVVQIVERATDPNPAQRYQSASDLEHALAGILGSSARDIPVAPQPPERPRRRWVAAGVAAALAAVVGALSAAAFLRPAKTEPAPVIQLTIGPPYNSASWPRLSPDGRHVVFGTLFEGRPVFWIRPLDSLQGRALSNTSALETPFWSPDGRQLAFFADDRLKTIDIESGRVEVLTEAGRPAHGGDWNQNGLLLFSTDTGLDRINADGTHRQHVTTLDRSKAEYQHGWPQFLPDRRRFLFVVRSNREEFSGVYVGSLDSPVRKRLMPAYSRVAYSPSGHLLFVRRGTLMAQAFDQSDAELKGEPFPLVGSIKYHVASDAAFDVSPNGILIYRLSEGLVATRLVLLDRRGRELQVISQEGYYSQPRFSPDATYLAVEKAEPDVPNPDIWIFDVVRRSSRRFTSSDAPDTHPVWSPDGSRVIFSSKRGSYYDVYQKLINGSEEESTFFVSPHDKLVEDWSRDGRWIVATVPRNGLWLFDVAASTYSQIRASTALNGMQAAFAPDSKYVAYTAEDTGSPEVYVEPLPATGARWQVSPAGGAEPHWRADGRELMYVSADGWLMSVPVHAQRAFSADAPRRMFRVAIPDLVGGEDVTISPDGERVAVNSLVTDATVPPIHVVINWPALLKRSSAEQ